MTQFFEYSLTQYTSFRQLEFQYIKIRDENEELKLRLLEIERLYENMAHQNISNRQRIHQTGQSSVQLSKIESERKIALMEINEIIKTITEVNETDESIMGEEASIVESLRRLNDEIKTFVKQNQKNKRSLNQMIHELNDNQGNWARRQQQFSEEIADLQHDLEKLQKIQSELSVENKQLLRQNQELLAQLKSYKAIAIQARNKSPAKLKLETESEFTEENASFATDLLSYQKQLLSRVFCLVIESFQNDDIKLCLRKIYDSYEDVSECFRQKLQLEYDLEDLECQYRKQKNSGPKQILIQLRREINNFRKELHSQKEKLYQQEDRLQERVKDLSGQAVLDNRLKSFTIDLQSKLRKQKTATQQSQKDKERSVIEWKQTPDDDVMKRIIEKDREAMEKILKETRSQFKR